VKCLEYKGLDGGERGIRTPDTLSGITVFKTAGFNRSPSSPRVELRRTFEFTAFPICLLAEGITVRSSQQWYKRGRMVKRSKPGSDPQPGQPISLRTLGDYLNLSPATISLVLNNAPGVRSIPQETRDRVIAAAAKFDYRPSFYARSLRKKQTYTVGVLVPELSDHYATHVLDGVEELLIEEGYFYLTASHHRKPDLIDEYPRMLMDRAVEGFVLIDTILERSLSLPVVAVAGHRKIEGVTNVVLDQRRAAELALRHLYQLGHRKIAFMRGGSHSSDADDRWSCLMAVARDLKLHVPTEYTVQLELKVSTPELGYEPANELLQRGLDFTALICYNDISAIGAIRACVNRGLQVPADVSIVGFDDIQSAAFHNPSLTTIRQPLTQMGKVAARILLQRIRGQATFPDVVPIHPELVIRESTCPPNPRRARGKRS
jgi:DNA-binding LacI/PurR family transcriptional regulator